MYETFVYLKFAWSSQANPSFQERVGINPSCKGKFRPTLLVHCTKASWLSGSVRDLQTRYCRFDRRLGWIVLRRCVPKQGTCPHKHCLDRRVRGYLLGQWRLVRLNSSARRKWQPGCGLPGELRCLMSEQVLWPGGNCVESGERCFALDTRPFLFLPPSMSCLGGHKNHEYDTSECQNHTCTLNPWSFQIIVMAFVADRRLISRKEAYTLSFTFRASLHRLYFWLVNYIFLQRPLTHFYR